MNPRTDKRFGRVGSVARTQSAQAWSFAEIGPKALPNRTRKAPNEISSTKITFHAKRFTMTMMTTEHVANAWTP